MEEYNIFWIAIILVFAVGLIVQAMLNIKFKKYSKVPCALSGAEIARKMLAEHGITDVTVTSVSGRLTDHYDPRDKTINLSEEVFDAHTLAAAAIAAHETGHAIQHATGYAPLRFRSAMVPVVTFCDKAVMWVILAGLIIFSITPALFWCGIVLFAATTFFSFATLPVEIDASRRAVLWLETTRITDYETSKLASSALRWAAYTYVVAAISSLLSLLYYIALGRNR